MPPVSSRTKTRSTPRSTSGLSGAASSSSGTTRTGRRLANRSSPLRRPSSACSGRTLARGIVPLRSADGAEQHRVARLRQVQRAVGQRRMEGVDRRTADDGFGERQLEVKALRADAPARAWPAPPPPDQCRRRATPGSSRALLLSTKKWKTGNRNGKRETVNAPLETGSSISGCVVSGFPFSPVAVRGPPRPAAPGSATGATRAC